MYDYTHIYSCKSNPKYEILNLFVNGRKRRRKQRELSPVLPPRKHKESRQKHVAIDNPIISNLDEESATEVLKKETFQRPNAVQKKVSLEKTKKRAPNLTRKNKREVDRRDENPKISDKSPTPALMKVTRSEGGHSEEESIGDGQPQEKQQKSLRPNSIMKMAALIKGKKKPPPEENGSVSNKTAVVRQMEIYAKIDKKKKKKTDYELPEIDADSSNQYTVLSKNKKSSDKNREAENLKERKSDETLMYENEDLYNIIKDSKENSNNPCQKGSDKIKESKKGGNITNKNIVSKPPIALTLTLMKISHMRRQTVKMKMRSN